MADSKREKTRYTGVYQLVSSERRHDGKPDVCWYYTLKDVAGKKVWVKTLHLPPPALAVLETLPHISGYCFPGKGKTGHIINIKDTWARLLETAGLTGWRIHDLRHAFASYAVSSGKSLPVIGAILGHTQAGTTQRYAHLADNPVSAAAVRTSIVCAVRGRRRVRAHRTGLDAQELKRGYYADGDSGLC